jgi:LAO/AO transport system kinase
VNNKTPKTAQDYCADISAGDRTLLARAITLIESSKEEDRVLAGELLATLAANEQKKESIRIGFSGAPGVGKSSLIEAFGMAAIEAGKKVAVLAIDPSGIVSGGSILGDKVRMAQLGLHERAFVRPSPARGYLGGVAQSTFESILLCEAAGYDVIIIETVGVGQSEYAVRQLVDIFVLLLMAGAGDDLQTIKRGILECFDILAVTKADGGNEVAAKRFATELREVIPQLKPATPGWTPVCVQTSAHSTGGVTELLAEAERFFLTMTSSRVIETKRAERQDAILGDCLKERFAECIPLIPLVAEIIKNEHGRMVQGEPVRLLVDSVVKQVTDLIQR